MHARQHQVSPLQQDMTALGLEVDPQIARQKKAERDYHHNVLVIPTVRLVGMGVLALFVLFHNLWVLDTFS